jgi:hypothetical protein
VRQDIWWAKLSMVKKKLNNSSTLEQRSLSTEPLTASMGSKCMKKTYRHPKALFCEPDIPSEPQPRQALVNIHLKDFTLIFRGRMPKDVVLNEHENSRTYSSGF